MNTTNSTTPIKILFVGNSYTGQIEDMFRSVLKGTSHANADVSVVWGGGATLERLINNGRALEWIKKQKWDYVVLQEQSVRPALAGRSENAFHEAVDLLVEEIRKIGAEPLLYMTWGRRDELSLRDGVQLDYVTMQQKLSAAYCKAAQRNEIRVVPVGEAWALVRKRDADLGRRLYKNDGSHPSDIGAFLVSCVFLRTLFDQPIAQLAIPEGVDPPDGELVRDVVTTMPQQKFSQ